MTNVQRDTAFSVVWDGAHGNVDADLLRSEWAIPEKCVAVAPRSRHARAALPPHVAAFLHCQAPTRWWTVSELAQAVGAQRESVRSALRLLCEIVERRTLIVSKARDPRWAFRWRRPA